MLKKLSIILASIMLVGAILVSPYIYEEHQYNNGNMVKVLEVHGVQSTDQGGFAMHFSVQDHEGNTYEVYTGRVAQWDKSADDYINIKYLKGVL